MSNPTDKLAKVLMASKNDPLKFFRDILKVDVDTQQAQLIKESVIDGSRVMVKSARGTGKTFVITGLTLYFLLLFKDVNIRILSPSEQQLKTVFMRELRKHIERMDKVFADYFDVGAMWVKNKERPTNEAHCITASVERPENASGVHDKKQVFLLDEASAIPDAIYETIIGSIGTASGGGHIIGTSNPNKSGGTFYSELFINKPKGWKLLTFTAAKCPMIPQSFIDEMGELYGVDSDPYRISVLGKFPRSDGTAFIPESIVMGAIDRMADSFEWKHQPVIMGVDIGRSLSGDKTVFVLRSGSKVIDIISFHTDDTMITVGRIMDTIKSYHVDCVYVDSTGVGGPVFDRVKEIMMLSNVRVPCVDVMVGIRSKDPIQYYNLRAELWGEMRQWLKDIGDIPNNKDLRKELCEMTWGYSNKMQLQMTSKKQLKSKGITSPDHADALALTFYDSGATIRRQQVAPRPIQKSNYMWI